MRPSLGRVVIFTRAQATESTPAVEYAARITGLRPAPKTVMVDPGRQAGGPPSDARRPATEADEVYWDVLVAADVHRFGHPHGIAEARGEVWFSPRPVRFDPNGATGTWRWPERV